MWKTGVFASELLGTAFLVAGVIASITLSKKFKLTGLTALIFGASVAALSLFGGVLVAETHINGGQGYGFANPGVAFMWSVAHNNWHDFLPAIVGEIVGALAIGIAFLVIAKLLSKDKTFAYMTEAFGADGEQSIVKNSIGETIGTTLFFGGVALVALAGSSNDAVIIALAVGISLFIGIVASSSFGSMLNPAVAIALFVVRIAINKGVGLKNSLINYANGFVFNYGIAGIIGGIFLAV